MPMPRKLTPEKYCQFCGERLERKPLRNGGLESLLHFGRRKFCDQMCMARDFDRRHREDAGYSAAHARARTLIAPGPCSRCGTPNALDVHHRDGNWQNNEPSNLERICRTCHNLAHHRAKPCTICGKPQKGLGYCDKHYQRFKKYGDPLMVKVNQYAAATKVED